MKQTFNPFAVQVADAAHAGAAPATWVKPVLFAVLTALALLPVGLVTVPPLVDYPNHLARIHILANIASDPVLQQNYGVDWSIRPNLGMDMLLPYLVHVMGTYDAGRLFIAVTLILLIASTTLLRRTLVGEIGFMPVLAYLFLYNHMFYWGFLNFLFGIGVSLLSIAFWIKYREKINIGIVLVSLLASTALFFIHFFAFCAYGYCILLYEIGRFRHNGSVDRRRRLVDFGLAFVPFLPAACLTLVWLAGSGSGAGEGLDATYGLFAWKLVALLSPIFWGANLIDVIFALSFVVLAIWVVRERIVTIAPAMKWALAGLCLLAPLIPNNITGVEIWAADSRLPILIALLFVASARLTAGSAKDLRVVCCFLLALFVWRVADVSTTWMRMDRDFAEFRRALAAVRPGSSLLVMQDREDLPEALKPLGDRNYWHMASLGAIERGTFTPMQFTGHMSLRASPRRLPIDSSVGNPLNRDELRESQTMSNAELSHQYVTTRHLRPYWGMWPKTFDYVVAIRFANRENPVTRHLIPIQRGTFFDLYRITDSAAD